MIHMTPMEAWHIISGNLSELAGIRSTLWPKSNGYSEEEIMAQVIAFEALRRMGEEE